MLLQQRLHPKKLQLENQVKSVNLDVNLLQGILRQNTLTKQIPKSSNKMSLQSLSQMLKFKNQKAATYRHQIQQTRQWLRDKGVDFKKINQEVKQNARVVIQFPSQKIAPKSALYQVVSPEQEFQWRFTRESQLQFIQKQRQFAVCKIISEQLHNPQKRNKMRNNLLNRVRGEYSVNKSAQINAQLQINKSFRLQQDFKIKPDPQQNYFRKKNEYFDFVNTLSTKGFQSSLQRLKNIKPFWKIVLQHIKTVQDYLENLQRLRKNQQNLPRLNFNQLKLNSKLMMKSLKLVQNQFQKTLPQSSNFIKQVASWTRQLERKTRDLKVWKNKNGQPSWAMILVLLRAGQTSQIRKILQKIDKQIYQDFAIHQQSLDLQDPKPSVKSYDLLKYNDNFFSQFTYILKGKPCFDQNIIYQKELSKTWILLRTLGIYRSIQAVQEKYQQIIQHHFENQANDDERLTSQKVANFLYLCGYHNFIKLLQIHMDRKLLPDEGQFNYDDYFHLLTVLNYYPQLWNCKANQDKSYFQNQYAEKLQKYMNRLKQDKNYIQLPKYLLLAPPKYMQKIACSIMKTRRQFELFDWKQLRSLLHQRDQQSARQLYLYLLRQVIKNLKLSSFQDYRFAADKYRQFFYEQKSGLFMEHKCEVHILLTYLYLNQKKKYYINKNQQLDHVFQQVFSLFQISHHDRSNQQLLRKTDSKISQYVKGAQMNLDQNIPRQYVGDMFYTSNVIIPYKFYVQFSRLNQLLQQPHLNLRELKQLKPSWEYSNYSTNQKQSVDILIRFLSSSSSSSIVSLYVFYLVALIQRKKIICNLEYDYDGLQNYMRVVLKQMQDLQTFYEAQTHKFHRVNRGFKQNQSQTEQQSSQQGLLQNPLKNCVQFKELKKNIVDYLKEYGGSIRSQGQISQNVNNRNSQSMSNYRSRYQY